MMRGICHRMRHNATHCLQRSATSEKIVGAARSGWPLRVFRTINDIAGVEQFAAIHAGKNLHRFESARSVKRGSSMSVRKPSSDLTRDQATGSDGSPVALPVSLFSTDAVEDVVLSTERDQAVAGHVLGTVIHTVDYPMMVLDDQLQVRLANRALCRVCGLPPADILGADVDVFDTVFEFGAVIAGSNINSIDAMRLACLPCERMFASTTADD